MSFAAAEEASVTADLETRFQAMSIDELKAADACLERILKYSVSGFTNAYKVEITPTKVYYSDGTSETIPESVRYTSTFEL